MDKNIPKEVKDVLEALKKAGFEAFAVGGCVRDLLIGREPKDWDATTNATPEQIQELFGEDETFYENDFGTVGVKVTPFLSSGKKDREHDVVEVTTYRTETTYSDRRRPDEITFAKSIEEDLARRDFTVNAVAMTASGDFVDPYGGKDDCEKKVLKAVGDADERFNEDALRMMRAIRLSAELDFDIEEKTYEAIKQNADLLTHVSMERIRDEFSRIVMSKKPRTGLIRLRETGLLKHIIPELEIGVGVEQNHHHIYDVWEHNIRTMETCPSPKLSVKLSALMHDIGKPESKEGEGRNCTFYQHEYIGERMARKILKRMKYPTKVVEHAALLVRNHMFYYSVDEVTETAVRRIIKKVGLENMKDLIDVRIGDRLGSGTPKGKPYKLRHFEYMVDKVSNDPVSVKMLKLNGDIMLAEMDFTPGPQIGAILNVLLAEAIEDPSTNDLEKQKERAETLRNEDLSELKKLAQEKIEEKRKEDDAAFKRQHHVK